MKLNRRSKVEKHEMRLDTIPFQATANGDKKIEIRVGDEKRKKIEAGDKIIFIKPDFSDQMTVTVKEIKRYRDSRDLVQKEDFSLTGGIYSSVNDWKAAIDSYYSQEKQQKLGILSIHFYL